MGVNTPDAKQMTLWLPPTQNEGLPSEGGHQDDFQVTSGSVGVWTPTRAFSLYDLDRALGNTGSGVVYAPRSPELSLDVQSLGYEHSLTKKGGVPYLDYIAKTPSPSTEDVLIDDEDDDWKDPCGYWSIQACCRCGRMFMKKLNCRREWCPRCREETESRRFSRWLPKAQQIEVMGYLVITFPREARPRSKDQLRKMRTKIMRGLKKFGFKRGLSRWHYFGEGGKEWHPHLNIILDYGKIKRKRLEEIKKMIAKASGVEMCVVNYQYSRVPARKVHMLKYVCRNTFLKKSWDPEMARELYGFTNAHWWGEWKKPPVWTLEEAESKNTIADKIAAGICPDCGEPIHWKGGKENLVPTCLLEPAGFKHVGKGYYIWLDDEIEFWDSS